MISLTILGAAAALATAPAAPMDHPPANAAPAAAVARQDPQDRMICQRMELTGTLAKRPMICKTRREWDQLRRDGQDYLGELQRKGGQLNSIPGG